MQKFIQDETNLNSDSFTVECATKPGDNYLSAIYRVTVKTRAEAELSFIVKSLTESAQGFVTVIQAFPREMLMYDLILPHMEKLWRDYSGETVPFGPRCEYTGKEHGEVIVLQDLKAIGFSMRDRRMGLHLEEAKMVLRKMAKFHACSVKRVEEVGDCVVGKSKS